MNKLKESLKRNWFLILLAVAVIAFGSWYLIYKSNHKSIVSIPLSQAIILSQNADFSKMTISTDSYGVSELTLTMNQVADSTDTNGNSVVLQNNQKVTSDIGSLNIEELTNMGFVLPTNYTQVGYIDEFGNIAGLLSTLMFIGMIIVIIWFFKSSMLNAGNNNKFSKAKGNLVRFSDVGGIADVKNDLVEVVSFLKNKKQLIAMGAKIPKGVLLVGAPGTGKTLLARAVANEAGVNFFYTTGSEFHSMWVGLAGMKIHSLFVKANKSQGIIFIDEFDSIAQRRDNGGTDASKEWSHTLNQLLAEMDGFAKNNNVLVIAATNRVEVLDPAVLRPGRFDRKIFVNLPSLKDRKAILDIHAKGKNLAPDADLEIVAQRTSGFSGADLELLLNEAAIIAIRENKPEISQVHLNEAINKVLVGNERKGLSLTDDDKKLLAYHEAGHALIAYHYPELGNVQQITILPHGQAGGFTHISEDKEDFVMAKDKFLKHVTMLLGGRASEELVLNDVSSGAQDDIRKANELVQGMVLKLGMGEKFGLRSDLRLEIKEMDGVAVKDIDTILNQCYDSAKSILNQNRRNLDSVAKKLVEVDTLTGVELKELIGG